MNMFFSVPFQYVYVAVAVVVVVLKFNLLANVFMLYFVVRVERKNKMILKIVVANTRRLVQKELLDISCKFNFDHKIRLY